MTDEGRVIHMLVENKYPLKNEVLSKLLKLKLETEEDRSLSLANHHTTNGLQFTMSNRHQELTSPEANGFCEELASPVPVQKQTTFGKDKSNPLIVDSLLKTIRFSIHLVVYNEELTIPEQTATGKGTSNPLMAGSLPKTTKTT
ncbi:hypothetical protein Tco_0909755 [Tanacetum coccineum]|uniref:Uncharacterized protein n=1 Tax=Tanacetum coccineum TaxID=301880 RepID=A0ABQ5CR23_9ASTR